MAEQVFNVGVIGYGLSAKVFHIPFIQLTPQFRLHSIVQRSPKEGNSAPADYPDLKHYNDANALIADPEVDIVVLSTTPDSHFDLTKAALEAGKHVLVEKPFVPTSAQAEDLISIAKDKGRLICVYQNRRWDLDFLTAKHLISQGQLGRVVEFNSHFDRYRADAPTNWKAQIGIPQAGSALFDLGTHLIDQTYVLFGLPQAVHGRLLNQRNGTPDFFNPDAVTIELTYADGLIVNLRISALSAEVAQPRFWVRGTKGSFRTTGLDPQEDHLRAGGKATDAGFGAQDLESFRLTAVGDDGKIISEVPVPALEPETYKALYAAFAKAVASRDANEVPVKATEARDVLRIIEGVIESAKTGKDAILS
uniref:Oxidoreductase n=1 Tax=Bionectria ochroleuca TaxID=29856 RepID=A0A8H7N4M1_BIOOC